MTRVEVKLADESGKRHLLAIEHNKFSRGETSVVLIPKFVIEDLYKELVVEEVNEARAEIAQITAKLAQIESLDEETVSLATDGTA